jgi:hypothetical protein
VSFLTEPWERNASLGRCWKQWLGGERSASFPASFPLIVATLGHIIFAEEITMENKQPNVDTPIWCSVTAGPNSLRVQGTLKIFPKILLHNPPVYPLVWIEVPDLTPLKMYTEPLMFIDTAVGEGIVELLNEEKIVQYVALYGPYKTETIRADHYQLVLKAVGEDKRVPVNVQQVPGPVYWKSQRVIDAFEERVRQEVDAAFERRVQQQVQQKMNDAFEKKVQQEVSQRLKDQKAKDKRNSEPQNEGEENSLSP